VRLGVVLALLAVAGCGGSDADVQNDLVFRDVSGTVIEMPDDVHVWCGTWDPGGLGGSRAMRVLVGAVEDGAPRPPYWRLEASAEGTPVGEAKALPWLVNAPAPRGAELFVAAGANQENASDTELSSGTLTVQQLSCREGGRIAFSVDATVGSEFGDGDAVTVEGRFAATVGDGPPAGVD
jgi:hypothetical protein